VELAAGLFGTVVGLVFSAGFVCIAVAVSFFLQYIAGFFFFCFCYCSLIAWLPAGFLWVFFFRAFGVFLVHV